MSTVITSRQNPLAVRLAKLASGKYRREEGLFLAEGVKLASEAVGAGAVKYLLITEDKAGLPLVSQALDCGGEVVIMSRGVMEKISTESSPQGVIAVCRMMSDLHCGAEKAAPSSGGVLILDRVRDPGNLGTILRSAEAFGGVRLYISGCADIYSPKTVRGSMGAVFRVPTVEFHDTECAVRYAKSEGRRVLGAALDKTAACLGDYVPSAADAVVIGTEGQGISPGVISMCDGRIYIPMSGGESLNCAVAASVIMWEMWKKCGKSG